VINLAVILIENIKRYLGVHADTKPTSGIPVGSTFFETDTKDLYVFDGTNWEVGNPTFQTGDTITLGNVEGKDAEAAAVTGKPVTVGYKDATGKATGVTPVNRLPVDATLSGRNVEEIFFYNAMAITDTGIKAVQQDLTKYQKVTFLARSTLDKDTDLYFNVNDTNPMVYDTASSTWINIDSNRVKIPANSDKYYVLNTFPKWDFLNQPLGRVTGVAQCLVAPTTGSFTLKAWGVPN
jgi:hypothetical protein